MFLKFCRLNQFVRQVHCKKDIRISRATECDKPEIFNFMKNVFFKTEPSSMICEVADKDAVSKTILELVTCPVDEGMSFLAHQIMKDKSRTIVGVAINGVRPVCYDPTLWEPVIETIKCDKERELLLLWQKISKLPDNPEEFFGCVGQLVELQYLSVHPNLQRQGIAKDLLTCTMSEACKKGFCFLRMDCTSEFSSRLGLRCGMKKIDEVYYKEMRDSTGKRYQNVEPPHLKATILIAELGRKRG